MKPSRGNAVWLAGLLAALACTDLPDAPEFDTAVASLRYVDTETAIAVGMTVEFLVEARNGDGFVIPNPSILWTSSNTTAVVVAGSGASALVTGRGIGNGTVRATSTQGGARAEVLVRVLPPH